MRSPSNSDGRAGFKPWAFGVTDVICVYGIRFLDCGIWEIRMSNLCWVFASFACNSARAYICLLQHSFYFYFYFEHLNFIWSYLIDTKISWSLDHISWSYLLILSWRSYLLIYDPILISWSYHLMMIQDMFLYTLLLTCIQHAFDSCLSLMINMHSTHVAAQHAFTLHLTCFEHTFYMCLPWGQHMDISI